MRVPVAADGGIQHYPERTWMPNPLWDSSKPFELQENPSSLPVDVTWEEFDKPKHMTLTLVRMQRGRSAAYFIWKNEATGATYPMFMSDMMDLVTRGTVSHGTATQDWVPSKRGQNYGIKMAKP